MEAADLKQKKEIKTVKVSPDLHQKIKVFCAERGEKMEVFVERALRTQLSNEVTQPARATPAKRSRA